MKKNIKPKWTAGDIVKGEWEERIIFLVTEDMYYYVTWRKGDKRPFFNPTKSAAGFPYMEQKYSKVGEYKKVAELQKITSEIMGEFGKVFAFADTKLGELIKGVNYEKNSA